MSRHPGGPEKAILRLLRRDGGDHGARRIAPEVASLASDIRAGAGRLGRGRAAAALAAYVALEWFSFIHEYKGVPTTPWNPGLGVMFALMTHDGPRYGLVLLLGVVVVEFFVVGSELDGLAIVAVGAMIAGGYALVAAAARRRFGLDPALSRLRDVLVLLGAAIVGAFIVAVLLLLLMIGIGQLEPRDTVRALLPLLVGDTIGIAVVTPLLLRFLSPGGEPALRRGARFAPEGALYVAGIAAALWVIVGAEGVDDFKYFYLLFVPVVAAAARHGLDGACLVLAATQLALVAVLQRHGHDAGSFTEFQTVMLALTATGLIVGVVVSERQNADRAAREAGARLKEKEAEAVQAARFHLLSGMASALAHEINQPMAAARALARSAQEILRGAVPDLARAGGNLAAAIAQIDRAGGIIRRMREFLRRGEPRISTVDLASVLDDALALIGPSASARRIAIERDLPDGLPLVHADRVQIQQVVLNLVQNAIESIAAAKRADGRIRIVVGPAEGASHIEVAVADNGQGVAPSLAGRLFDPLTTSKGDGLGLGLSICASIVESHGGSVWLHSGQPGRTEFRFTLPLRHPRAGAT
jgi:signal transduction histidine kinase